MLIAHVERYLSLRRTLGFKLRNVSGNLRAFARFAADRGDTHIRAATAVAWATEAPSPAARHVRRGGGLAIRIGHAGSGHSVGERRVVRLPG